MFAVFCRFLAITIIVGTSMSFLHCGSVENVATVELSASHCIIGSTRCVNNGVATCIRGRDSQIGWSKAKTCDEDNPWCSHGVCTSKCVDECAPGEIICDGRNNVRICGQADDDECNDWMPPLPCDDGDVCTNGVCDSQCMDECTLDDTVCRGNGTVTCTDLDGDGCTEWSAITPCAENTSCSFGRCDPTCEDECNADECQNENIALHYTCGQFDFDSCRDRSPGEHCIPSDSCHTGLCEKDLGCQSVANICPVSPEDECLDNDTLLTYADPIGTCNPETGDCDYSPQEMDCPNCPSCDACTGIQCTPEPSTCSRDTRIHYSSRCINGTCQSSQHYQLCASGCLGGACLSAPETIFKEDFQDKKLYSKRWESSGWHRKTHDGRTGVQLENCQSDDHVCTLQSKNILNFGQHKRITLSLNYWLDHKLDNGDFLVVELYYDGAWRSVFEPKVCEDGCEKRGRCKSGCLNNSTWRSASVNVPVAGKTNVLLRLRAKTNKTGKDYFVDDIVISRQN